MANRVVANPHIVSIVMKELVRRAIVIARGQRASFEVQEKLGYGGDMNDMFTTADKKAQEIYVRSLRECFPQIGIIGEEDSLSISGKNKNTYFSIDPIDGTRAYVRRQSHGIGSMIALIVNNKVEAAYIGDINSQEIFGFRPQSKSVWRITQLELYEKLDDNPKPTKLSSLNIILREREKNHSLLAQRTVDKFKSVLIDGGSIGTWMARLWKREVGAVLLAPAWCTPWDWNPVFGISDKLGYVFLKSEDGKWRKYETGPVKVKSEIEHDIMIIHKNDLEQLRKI